MKDWIFRYAGLFLVSLMVPGPYASADIAETDLPGDVQWYAHADFKAMEGSVTGSYLLEFLDKEVFAELRQDTGIDLRKDLSAATVFGGRGADDGAVVLHGKLSERNRTKVVALMEMYGDYRKESRGGTEIFALTKRGAEDGPAPEAQGSDRELFSEDRTTYLAFGPRNQTVITQSSRQLELFVESGGRFAAGSKSGDEGGLLVLRADRSLLKAGMNAGAGIGDSTDWNSSILQHMKQVALVLSDQSGKAALEARLVTSQPELAESIKNIVQGLIAIKSLDEGADPEILALLGSIKLDLAGSTIRASMLLEPETLREVLD